MLDFHIELFAPNIDSGEPDGTLGDQKSLELLWCNAAKELKLHASLRPHHTAGHAMFHHQACYEGFVSECECICGPTELYC